MSSNKFIKKQDSIFDIKREDDAKRCNDLAEEFITLNSDGLIVFGEDPNCEFQLVGAAEFTSTFDNGGGGDVTFTAGEPHGDIVFQANGLNVSLTRLVELARMIGYDLDVDLNEKEVHCDYEGAKRVTDGNNS